MVEPTQPRVIVIGGGPSGTTAATLIAQRGYKVRLLEREHFPRYHIGESLIPQTYHVMQRLNMLDKMKASEFVRKYSVQFVGSSGRLSEPFYFLDHKPHESSQTWQVRRSDFDMRMMDNAIEHGVDVQQGVRVLEVLFEGDRAVGVRVQDEANGGERIERADVIVDASGQSSLIMGKLGLREWDPALKKAAVWTYWEGAWRDTGRDEGATVVLQIQGKAGWFWYIPLHDNIVSVGAVADYGYLFKNRDTKDFEAIYNAEVDKCPAVKERISIGKRVEPFRAAKEYSYRSQKAAGNGWVLVGDAFGFLDPLYSSGVLLALKSGELAADAVCEGLAKGDTSGAQLGAWEADYVRGMERMRSLVCAYYQGFSFGKFVAKHPHRKGDITDLLIGDLFRPELDETLGLINEALQIPAMAEAG
ncbi:NAD(P)/FAD-dependent oxidoreductase [Schlesneria paludicola]|uniref:NAD(P)/FAD-dependent oxidoreductase n=1 Tax=Schlesneria paludicola TaxID=360056 RepID=UPI00029ADEEA|nr:NAD(P)/FAD-dependent oxidoreductase [Schlesneria paludicola]